QVITKRKHRFGLSDASVRAERLFQERLRHRGYVLMREAYVSNSKERVSRLHRRNTNFSSLNKRMPRNDLLDDSHRPVRLFRWGTERWWRHFTRYSRFVVIEEPTVFNDVSGDGIEAARELLEWDLLATTNTFHEPEISRGQQSNVLRVLPV